MSQLEVHFVHRAPETVKYTQFIHQKNENKCKPQSELAPFSSCIDDAIVSSMGKHSFLSGLTSQLFRHL